MFRFRLLALIVLVSLSQMNVADAAEKAKLKGLLISGGCCHDYPNQVKILTLGLSQRASIEWDVVLEGDGSREFELSLYKNPDWAKGYDVIVHNECFGSVGDAKFIAGIVNAHHAGVPGVFIHCSLHSYRMAGAGSEGWRELIGVTSTSHEKHRAVLVKNINAEHPVMRGFPAEWKTPNGELYKIEKIWPNCTPLAEAFGEDTQKDHTVIWVNTFGKAKVFGTSLGHHNETMNTDEWLDVVGRGLLWTVDGLNDDGTAKAGFAGTGKKRIVLEALKPHADPNVPKKP